MFEQGSPAREGEPVKADTGTESPQKSQEHEQDQDRFLFIGGFSQGTVFLPEVSRFQSFELLLRHESNIDHQEDQYKHDQGNRGCKSHPFGEGDHINLREQGIQLLRVDQVGGTSHQRCDTSYRRSISDAQQHTSGIFPSGLCRDAAFQLTNH